MTTNGAPSSSFSILVHGGTGRVGRTVLDVASRSDDAEIRGILDVREGRRAPAGPHRLFHRVPEEPPGVDVVVDFSVPHALAALIEILRGTGVRLVCGTTGLGVAERNLLEKYSEECAVLYDENMSYGVSVMKKMLETGAPLLRDVTDVEIVEIHHSGKRDYPSGTAYALSRIIDPEAAAVPGRDRAPGEGQRAIHIHSARVGGVPGDHQVVFASREEVITLSHRALSREVFARGALRAAKYLVTRSKGMFSMKDLIEAKHE